MYGDAQGVSWGSEAIMLSAGTNIEWLRDDLQIIDTAAHSDDIAAQVTSSDGVVYVSALLGLGTPHWDYGARGSLFGITRGTTRAHVVRAVLEGIAIGVLTSSRRQSVTPGSISSHYGLTVG